MELISLFWQLAYIYYSGSQVFYLADEADHKGKGANTVTSFLHHHFQQHGYGEEDVKLHMDNCSGQNKNNTVLWYVLLSDNLTKSSLK